MEQVTLNAIKRFVAGMRESKSLAATRKTVYVEGYRACVDDIDNIIKMANELSKAETSPAVA